MRRRKRPGTGAVKQDRLAVSVALCREMRRDPAYWGMCNGSLIDSSVPLKEGISALTKAVTALPWSSLNRTPGTSQRAADRDRTGIISLEG